MGFTTAATTTTSGGGAGRRPRAVVVVDPISSGAVLALLAQQRGMAVVAVYRSVGWGVYGGMGGGFRRVCVMRGGLWDGWGGGQEARPTPTLYRH
jgi:hypothetical protein